MSKALEIKIIILGNSSVGKTSFITKYIDDEFFSDYITTLGVDSRQKKITLQNGKEARLKIFDTAGQERFKALSTNFIKKAEGIVLLYDISNKVSFEEISNWMETIKENGRDSVSVILVGNKCDLSDDKRQVSKNEGQERADKYNLQFFETSCREGINVNEVFDKLVEDIEKKNNVYSSSDIKIINIDKKKRKFC